MQIATEFRNTQITNYFYTQAFRRHSARDGLGADEVYLVIEDELALAANPDALIERIAAKLLGGEISETLHAAAKEMVETRDADSAAARVAEALFLIVSSPEFARQH